MFIFYVGFLITLWFFFKDELDKKERLILISLFAFNPFFLQFGNHILSDIPFLFFSTLTILIIYKFNKEENLNNKYLYIIALTLCFFISSILRSHGLLLPILYFSLIILFILNQYFSKFILIKKLIFFKNFLIKRDIFILLLPIIFFALITYFFSLFFPSRQSIQISIFQEQKKINPNIEIKIINGLGKGKYKAVKLGLQNASGYYSMIFDADITVDVCDLELFYEAISNNRADIINGSRLIYKPYAGAMRRLNYFGNIFFAKLLSFIISSNGTDTLCGTKCFKTQDYKIFDEFEEKNNINDLWGDFNILFSSSLFCLNIIDLPIRYKKREEGVTKMNRRFYFFRNMIITCAKAFYRFKLKSF